jgi:protein-glutamine gamma-glutamyltransferase
MTAAAVRIGAFAALCTLAAGTWATLLQEPPVGRIAAVIAIAAGGAAALSLLDRAELPRLPSRAAAGAVCALTIALGLVASGLPASLLAPSGWGELADGVSQGVTGLADAEYPYGGDNPWVRQVILLAVPLALGAAAVLAFWPGRARRSAGLVLILLLYGVAVTVSPPAAPLLWGVLLLGLVAAWIWLPGLERRSALVAVAAVAIAGVLGVGTAAALEPDEPVLDWTKWSFPGDEPAVGFRWNHDYGPIDWPRDGTALLRAESDEPHYWRTIQLDYFDGIRWEVATERLSIERPLELPEQVEGAAAPALERDWIEQVGFVVGALDSGLLVAPGAVLDVEGMEGVTPGVGGTTLVREQMGEGDQYEVTSYVPQPSADRLRRAPERYPEVLRRYTQLELPAGLPLPAPYSGLSIDRPQLFSVPLRGDPVPAAVRQRLERSLYAEVHQLAVSLTAEASTTYDAVNAIELHLRREYEYSESPPERRVPLRDFLFRDRVGYCQQFSGAMALMLRTLGIPARVASGFSSGEREEGSGAFQVRDRDAHSWVEVYFVGVGWVPFEPTPAAAPAGEQLTELASGREQADTAGGTVIPRRGLVVPSVDAPAGAVAASDGEGAIVGALRTAGVGLVLAIVVAALGLGLWLARRAARFRRLDRAVAAAAQARELERALPMLGFPIPAGATLVGLERRFASRRALSAYLAALRSSRFATSSQPPGRDQRRALRRELGADRGLSGRLRALLAIPPGAPRED